MIETSAKLSVGTEPVSKKVGQALFWNILFFPISYLMGFGLSLLIVWLLGLELYAVYALILSFVSVAAMFTSLGVPAALNRFVAELGQTSSREHVLFFLKRTWLASGGVLLIMIVALNAKPYVFLRRFQLEVYGQWMVVGISMILLFRVWSTSMDGLLKAFFQHRTTNVVQMVYGLVRPASVVVVLLWSRNVMSVLGALVLAEGALMIMLGCSLWRYLKVHRWMSSSRPLPDLRGRFVRFAGTAYIRRLIDSCIKADFVILLLALKLQKTELALIAFAYNILNRFLSMIQRPVSDILPAYFNLQAASRQGSEIPREAASLLSKAVILAFSFGGVGFLCFTPRLVELLCPPEFLPAVSILLVLIVFFFGAHLVAWPASTMLTSYEQNIQITCARSILLLNVPLMFVAYSWLGIVGPALSAGMLHLTSCFIMYWLAHREFSWSLRWDFLAKVVACALLWGGALAWGLTWAPPGWISTIAVMAVGGVLLVPFLAGPRWFTTTERKMLLALEVPGTKWFLRFLRFEPARAREMEQRT
jgi:O-antigen/teichoic acid export membrane protein